MACKGYFEELQKTMREEIRKLSYLLSIIATSHE